MALPRLQFQMGFSAISIPGKLGLLFLLLGLLSAGYYLVVHMSMVNDIESAISDTERLQNSLKEARARLEEYLKLRAELADREPIDRNNMRVLPESAEIPAFLGDINRLAELSGLDMKRVQSRPETRAEFYVKIPVSLAISGRFHQLAKFFYNISRLERAVNMEDISLSNPINVGGEIGISVSVLATTFRRVNPSDAPMKPKK